MKTKELTREELIRLLEYNPATGTFTWKANKGRRGRGAVGREAGTLCNGYRKIRINGKSYQASALAVLYMTGILPVWVRTANNEPADLRWSNLDNRMSPDKKFNLLNREIAGVYYQEKLKKWTVLVKDLKQKHYFGIYSKWHDAVIARYCGELQLGWHNGDTLETDAKRYVDMHFCRFGSE